MKLNLKNPIVFFDLETTGTNINTDRIVEICYLKVYPNGNEEAKTLRINPEMHIPEASSAIHGIYDADVVDCPTFKEVAKNIARDIEGCDLAGFNSSFSKNVDFAGRMVYDDNGVEVFNFGKYKGMSVAEVLKKDPGYYSWILNSDFTLNTKAALTKIRLREMSNLITK